MKQSAGWVLCVQNTHCSHSRQLSRSLCQQCLSSDIDEGEMLTYVCYAQPCINPFPPTVATSSCMWEASSTVPVGGWIGDTSPPRQTPGTSPEASQMDRVAQPLCLYGWLCHWRWWRLGFFSKFPRRGWHARYLQFFFWLNVVISPTWIRATSKTIHNRQSGQSYRFTPGNMVSDTDHRPNCTETTIFAPRSQHHWSCSLVIYFLWWRKHRR